MQDQDYTPPDPPVAPYLMVRRGHEALDWYARAFGATVSERYLMDDGRLGHAMLSINGGAVYLSDEFPEMVDQTGTLSPDGLGGTCVTVVLAVGDVDRWITRAEAEGATVIRPARDEFYGRQGKLRDPFGHVWSLTGPKAGA